jgi:hypothetical protein
MFPQNKDVIDSIMPLVITPEPQKINRIWFYFVKKCGNIKIDKPADIEVIQRYDYSAVEWGGLIK